MKLITKKIDKWRPSPYPCFEVYERIRLYFLGIRYRTIKNKIKDDFCNTSSTR